MLFILNCQLKFCIFCILILSSVKFSKRFVTKNKSVLFINALNNFNCKLFFIPVSTYIPQYDKIINIL